ncbi:MAG: virulence factor [Anaerolineae bacterium]
MARYQILYWEYIPLGVKATDVNGTVRENLPARFQQAVENAASRAGQTSAAAYTSMFKWGKEQEREGSAAEVAAAIAKELDATWNEEEALGLFEKSKKRE